MRGLTALLLLHFTLATLAPAWIVGDFWLEHARIERDLCVQRMVPEAHRTCHGECQLMGRLKECGAREQNLPNELRAVRINEMIVEVIGVMIPTSTKGNELPWGTFSEGALDGHPQALSPVPWC